ncbi:MAG: DMT family transporter [Epsilonproteobacteria bacterium]|nr:DMT family transporter [Campylobacterota bacterium]
MLKKIDRGVVLMLLASFIFAIMGGAAKILSDSLPPLEITFFRNIFGVAIIAAALIKRAPKNRGGKPLLLFFRGFIGFLALVAYFYNMAHIPLGVAVTYNKTSPLFLAFFAWLFLNEKLPKSAILALILGFMGIVLIAKPEGFSFSKYDILGIFSGIGAALAYTSIRELRKYYDTRTIALSFMLTGTIGPLILMVASYYIDSFSLDFLFSKFVMPKGSDWFFIIVVGVSATISQLLMTKAYSLTKAGIVGTITYTQILFAIIIGTLLGDSFPDIYTLLGILLIITAGVLVVVKK